MKKIILFFIGTLSPFKVLAAINLKDTYGFECQNTPFIGCTFAGTPPGTAAIQLAGTVAAAVIASILTVATIAVLYGAYRIMTSRGNSEGVEAGKKAIMWAVFGYVLATLTIPIINFIKDFIDFVGTQGAN